MKPREIIARAWDLTRKEHSIRRWGFASALLATILNVQLFGVQFWYIYSYFWLDQSAGFMQILAWLFSAVPIPLVIVLCISLAAVVIAGWLFPHLAKGAIIGMAAKSYNNEKPDGGLVLGMYNFFPLFGVHELLVLSGITTVVSLCSLAIRYLGNFAIIACSIIIGAFICSMIMEFFWIFAEEAIVIQKAGVRSSIKQSFKLVISHLSHVVFLLLLLLVIALRIVANGLMVIIIPAIIFGIGFALTRVLSPVLSYSIATVFGCIAIVLASYFFAYLEVFRQTVWTLTYIELLKVPDLDVIHVESAATLPDES